MDSQETASSSSEVTQESGREEELAAREDLLRLIECPNCETRFALPTVTLLEEFEEDPELHCSRCDQLFQLSENNFYSSKSQWLLAKTKEPLFPEDEETREEEVELDTVTQLTTEQESSDPKPLPRARQTSEFNSAEFLKEMKAEESSQDKVEEESNTPQRNSPLGAPFQENLFSLFQTKSVPTPPVIQEAGSDEKESESSASFENEERELNAGAATNDPLLDPAVYEPASEPAVIAQTEGTIDKEETTASDIKSVEEQSTTPEEEDDWLTIRSAVEEPVEEEEKATTSFSEFFNDPTPPIETSSEMEQETHTAESSSEPEQLDISDFTTPIGTAQKEDSSTENTPSESTVTEVTPLGEISPPETFSFTDLEEKVSTPEPIIPNPEEPTPIEPVPTEVHSLEPQPIIETPRFKSRATSEFSAEELAETRNALRESTPERVPQEAEPPKVEEVKEEPKKEKIDLLNPPKKTKTKKAREDSQPTTVQPRPAEALIDTLKEEKKEAATSKIIDVAINEHEVEDTIQSEEVVYEEGERGPTYISPVPSALFFASPMIGFLLLLYGFGSYLHQAGATQDSIKSVIAYDLPTPPPAELFMQGVNFKRYGTLNDGEVFAIEGNFHNSTNRRISEAVIEAVLFNEQGAAIAKRVLPAGRVIKVRGGLSSERDTLELQQELSKKDRAIKAGEKKKVRMFFSRDEARTAKFFTARLKSVRF